MNLDQIRESLEQKLDQLSKRVTKIESDLRDPGSKDSEERAIESENKEVLEHLNDAEREEIESIRAALARIEDGTYSLCASCGNEIGNRRLEALPYTSLCLSCAS